MSLDAREAGNNSGSEDLISSGSNNGYDKADMDEITDDIFGGRFSTSSGLERIRKRLLDLTRSNPLLNYRFPKSKCLKIIDTPPDDLFNKLYNDGKASIILAVPEPHEDEYVETNGELRKPDVKTYAESKGINTSYELAATAERANNLNIRALLYAEELEALLRKIDQTAKTAIEESGTNMLYLVYGYLEWYESTASEKPLLAPLLIMPVALKRVGIDRSTGYFQYSVEYTGEDLAENMTVREKMKRDFSLEMPELEEDDTPESYFGKIAEFIKPRPQWKLRRNGCLCLLSFGRLLMYLDLDPLRWPNGSPLHKHPIISSFFEGIDRNTMPGIAEEYHIDDEKALNDIPLVCDADSSQHSALVDALKGKNLVIEGPPGTGKSQTITNLIAAALFEGKTVLFVSEKLAALEVVRRNLDRVNLGDFCLALHSHKTQKKKLLEDVRTRMEKIYPPPQGLEIKIRELTEKRDKLKHYVNLVNSVRDNRLGLTVYKVLWASERYRSAFYGKVTGLPSVDLPDASEASVERFNQLDDAVLQFIRHMKDIGTYGSNHPWYGYYPSDLMFGDDAKVGEILGNLRSTAEDLKVCTCKIEDRLKLTKLGTHESVSSIYKKVSDKMPLITGNEAFGLLPHILTQEGMTSFKAFEDRLINVRGYEAQIKKNLANPALVSSQDLEKSRLMMGYAETIRQEKTPYDVIISRGHSLSELGTSIKEALTFFSGIAYKLEVKFIPTRKDTQPLLATCKVAGAAPLDLLSMRNSVLLDTGMAETVREAQREAERLLAKRKLSQDAFELSVLPTKSELSAAARTFLSGGGFFRVFKKNWREAKTLYKGIRRNKKGRQNADTCAKELLLLVEYLEAKAAFDGNSNYRNAIGKTFHGIDTDFGKILRLIQWCESAKSEFLECASHEGLQCREVLDLPPEKLEWLSARSAEAKKHWEVLLAETQFIESLFTEHDFPAGLRGVDRLDSLCNELSVVAGMMKEVGTYYKDRFQVPISPIEAIDTLEAALKIHQLKTEIQSDQKAKLLLGEYYKELDTDLSPIHAVIKWSKCIDEIELPTPVRNWLLVPEAGERMITVKSLFQDLYNRWMTIEGLLSDMRTFGELDYSQWYCSNTVTPEVIVARVNTALNALHALVQWADFSRSVVQMNTFGLGQFCIDAMSGTLPIDDIQNYFRYSFYASVAKNIMKKNPELMMFSGINHSQIKERYIQLDEEVRDLNGLKCAHKIAQAVPSYGNGRGPVKTYTETALIQNELKKKSRHIPIRQLLRRAGRALQTLKPCFMMGPLSVSQYLEPGAMDFALIIMDEASQLKPEDALGAIARGKQIIVVGDPKQLPPTSFFDRLLDDTSDDDEDTESAIDGAESILDISQFLFQPVRRLRWHYRSQHESLIAFSNRHFYDNHLVLFPSPHGPKRGLGVRYNYIKNTRYENRCNRLEAERVADAVIAHFQHCPDESLGVVTLNITQRDLIEEEIDKRLKQYQGVMDYLSKWEEESYPFFIKNLENVQGDERDVIFISTTFGRGPQGVLRMNFGPINRQMGWRRLNVLFTRAKRRVEVFTSMEPEDIRVESNTPRGVKALKDYLTFAKLGELEAPEFTARDFDSDFEIAVAEVLMNKGYEVVPQLGVAGFFIDLAVRNPDRPGDFLACVECDGAAYHSGLSVRDRDRLRQQVLERLGWRGKIYRIWSSDWFKDPLNQTKKLLNFLDQLRLKAKEEPTPSVIEVDKELEIAPCVEVGDYVTYNDIEYPEDTKNVLIINGPSDLKAGIIGENTPLAQALLEAKVDDEVELTIPGMKTKILKIVYLKKQREERNESVA